jgi:uncharacterized phage-associated protein
MSFFFDESKALAAVLLVIKKQHGKIDRHKLFKILYFADQKHLVRYGRPIIGDTYIAMKDGPVPSTLYDAIKSINDTHYFFELFKGKLKTRDYLILSDIEPDIEELSESDIECLLESIDENAELSFLKLRNKSHGIAWGKANRDDKISLLNIALEGHANREMLHYIKENIEDSKFSITLS